MMDKYQHKRIYGGKNYINAVIELSHEERLTLENISKKKDPPKDNEKYRNIENKFEKYFKENI